MFKLSSSSPVSDVVARVWMSRPQDSLSHQERLHPHRVRLRDDLLQLWHCLNLQRVLVGRDGRLDQGLGNYQYAVFIPWVEKPYYKVKRRIGLRTSLPWLFSKVSVPPACLSSCQRRWLRAVPRRLSVPVCPQGPSGLSSVPQCGDDLREEEIKTSQDDLVSPSYHLSHWPPGAASSRKRPRQSWLRS